MRTTKTALAALALTLGFSGYASAQAVSDKDHMTKPTAETAVTKMHQSRFHKPGHLRPGENKFSNNWNNLHREQPGTRVPQKPMVPASQPSTETPPR